jgi:uncharacterized protein YraI
VIAGLSLLFAGIPASQALAQSPAETVATAPSATVDVAAVNLRSGPGTGYAVIGSLHQGDIAGITCRDAAGQWYQVQTAGGSTGWVDAAYVQTGADPGTLAIVAAPALPAPAAAATAGQSGASGRAGATGPIIVFQVSSGGAIYAVNPDGTGLRYLTTGIDPALSPDGKTVAFTRWEGSANGAPGSLWVINVDGTGEHQVLGNLSQPKSPTWSPDGKEIAVSLQQGGSIYPQRQTVTMTPGQRPAIPSGATDITVNGNQISFVVPANPNWGLRTVNLATGSYQDLPRETHSFAPAWDPADPNRIVFQGDTGLENVNLSQNTTSSLTGDVSQWAPVFSPDGSKIATSYQQSGNWEVHVMNADGSGDARLTQTPATVLADEQLQGQQAKSWNNAAPAWSPDGSQIAVVTDRNGHWEIWVMNADGSNQHPLFDQSVQDTLNIQYNGVDERVSSWH